MESEEEGSNAAADNCTRRADAGTGFNSRTTEESGDSLIARTINGKSRLRGWSFSGFTKGGRRLLAAAAMLHVALAVGLFCAGRARVAPGLIDRDGIMASFAFDSYEYQRGAARLAGVLKEGDLGAWATAREPAHVKLIALQFALLSPLFGHSTLCAEPLNLLCYLAVVAFTLALGSELGGSNVGLVSAGAVALWPTYLLHTTQFLKDPLYIAAALALVLLMTTWLTRDYGRREAAGAGALMAAAIGLLLLIRGKFAFALFALVLFGFALLVVRQVLERRTLYWNMVAPLPVLVAGALFAVYAAPGLHATKHNHAGQGGPPKSAAGEGVQLPASVSYLTPARPKTAHPTYAERLHSAADRAALEVGGLRHKFNVSFPGAGSGIDVDVELKSFAGLMLHLPRALEVGLWAPFPNTWAGAGQRVGSVGRLLSAAETFVIYLCQLLALVGVLRPPRRLAGWLLFSIVIFGVTALGLVIPNVGALYRFRYTFWVLLIILGVKGFEGLVTSARRSAGNRVRVREGV